MVDALEPQISESGVDARLVSVTLQTKNNVRDYLTFEDMILTEWVKRDMEAYEDRRMGPSAWLSPKRTASSV